MYSRLLSENAILIRDHFLESGVTILEESTQTQETKKNNTAKAGIAIVGLIVIVVVAIIAFQAVSGESTTQNTSQTSPAQEQMIAEEESDVEGSMTSEESDYADGTYSAVGTYITPGGAQKVGVTLTLVDGVIESVEVDRLGTLPTSKEKQADFAANYKPFVLGKDIDEVKLTKVSGSSLTPKGFNDALNQIKEEAGA